jgi:hypothetical protein
MNDADTRMRLAVLRDLCVAVVEKYHPTVFGQAGPIVEATEDEAKLKQWILAAPELGDDELLEMVDQRWAGTTRRHELNRMEAFRRVCTAFARVYHPAVYGEIAGIIDGCKSAARLHEWGVIAPEVDDARFVQRLRREAKLP